MMHDKIKYQIFQDIQYELMECLFFGEHFGVTPAMNAKQLGACCVLLYTAREGPSLS